MWQERLQSHGRLNLWLLRFRMEIPSSVMIVSQGLSIYKSQILNNIPQYIYIIKIRKILQGNYKIYIAKFITGTLLPSQKCNEQLNFSRLLGLRDWCGSLSFMRSSLPWVSHHTQEAYPTREKKFECHYFWRLIFAIFEACSSRT